MTFLSNNLIAVFILLIFSATSLTLCFYINYKKLRRSENKKLEQVFDDFETENHQRKKLQNVSEHIDLLEKRTKKTFSRINIEILNIDFSYKEILNNL